MRIALKSDKNLVPASYEVFYEEWYIKLKNLVYYKGYFPLDCVEDVTQELMLNFFEGNYLEVFDPQKEFINKRTGLPTKVKFSTFVYSWANKTLLGKRDKYRRLFWHEGLSANSPLSDEEDVTFLENLKAVSDNYEFELADFIEYIRSNLKKRKVTSLGNNMPLLFDTILKHLAGNCPEDAMNDKVKKGSFSIMAVAKELKVSHGGIDFMMKSLRNALEEIGVSV